MNNPYEFNSLQFIADGGPVSMLVAIILLVMSVASWYLILVKGYRAVRLRKVSTDFIRRFWHADSLQAALRLSATEVPAARVVNQAARAAEHYRLYGVSKAAEICNRDEFIARSMRKVITEASAQQERGLTVLASVGSIAPFVGLFGTVWGIYHALASISLSGQATLDKVAGPVGEALIMTALGLAVAIPAVLAYNTFVRMNRNLLADTESFAQEVHVLLTTGAALKENAPEAQPADARTAGHLHEVPA